ncbi:unnamed protein product [Mucor hiemalis]
MSFKFKQRAKHGHLFGDDPLNAVLVSASDYPLFSPTKTSKSSRTDSPTSNDPLSRNSRPSSPLDTSSSTPITPRRTTNTKTSGSIFGDIDVSKLGGANEDLFGGGRVSRTRVLSKATSPTLSNASSLSKKSPPSNSPILSEPTTILPTPRKSPSPTPPNSQTIIAQPTPEIAASPAPSPPPIEENTRPIIEEKPSFFASASRFFKSSSNTQSKASSSASSIASVNSSNIHQEDPPRKNTQPTLPQQPQQPQQPLRKPQQQPQQQPQHLQQKNTSILQSKSAVNHTVGEEEEEEEEQDNNPVIEDEATLAFADDVINFKARNYQPDYASIAPDLSMDALSLDVHSNKRLLPSASTPTASQADMDDPWFDGAAIMSSTTSFATPSKLPIALNIEPSISSPLQQRHHHEISEQDIEPQKRSAFADLISSWNTGQTNNDVYRTVHTEDPEQFFSHVAEEQRDIGFAGISNEDENEHRRTRTISAVEVWHDNEENPWN